MSSIPIPLYDPIARPKDRRRFGADERDPQEGFATEPWVRYLTANATAVSQAAARLAVVELSGQSTSLTATAFAFGDVVAGLYRLSYYATVSRAATTSSSLSLTFTHTDGGLTKSITTTAITGNTTATYTAGMVLLRVDNAAPVTFGTTYASVGATTMQYTLVIVVEKVR